MNAAYIAVLNDENEEILHACWEGGAELGKLTTLTNYAPLTLFRSDSLAQKRFDQLLHEQAAQAALVAHGWQEEGQEGEFALTIRCMGSREILKHQPVVFGSA